MEMKLKFLSLLCLVLVQVHSQDIEPEYPEEFPTTTTAPAAATTTTTSDVELVETTTTTESQREPTETEATTTEMPRTSTETVPSTTTNRLPFYPTYIPPPLPTYLPPVKPHYSTTTYNPIYWDLTDSSEEPHCYLREQEERSYVRWNCGMSSWSPIKNCYRCCYYGHSRFAGCNKLYNGPCRNAISASWYI